MFLNWFLYGVLVLIGLAILYLLFWPVPVNPSKWSPQKAPSLHGVYAPNTRLEAIERLPVGEGLGPEDVAIDGMGRIYTGIADSRILRLQPDGSNPEIFAQTGGRPLGLAFDARGNLIVADAEKGLLSIDPDKIISVLVDQYDGQPLFFANNLDTATDGTIYFSQSSTKFTMDHDMADILENRPNGRLLAYQPKTGETRLILDELYFANGVALGPDQNFVLVAETNRYRIRRIWLEGSQAGKVDIFCDNLPGLPDNIHFNGGDIFWVGLPALRQADQDALYSLPLVRKMLFRLPASWLPTPKKYGLVLGLDLEGNVVSNLQDPSGNYATITSAKEHGGYLYLGSLFEKALGRLNLSEFPIRHSVLDRPV